MGTTYTIKLAAGLDESARRRLHAAVDARLERINDQMSTWREDSEISRFNRSRSTGWFAVSPETAAVVAEAIRVSELTGGAFDVTVGPLVDLWGFGAGRTDGPPRVPGDEEIARLKSRCGCRLIGFRRDSPALRKLRPDVEIDLSAIAKGFGVDEIARLLEGEGHDSYMVEIGGEVRAQGSKPDGSGWMIGVQTPEQNSRHAPRAVRRLNMNGRAVATSGDYYSYFEKDGRRYSHTLDPRTGRPVEHGLASVTVVHDSCMTADALATALMVVGPEAAYNLADSRGWPVLLLIREGDRFVEKATPGFREFIVANKPQATTMQTFLLALAVFGLAVLAMAVGWILGRRRLRGTCGGIANLRDRHGNITCFACEEPSEECEGIEAKREMLRGDDEMRLAEKKASGSGDEEMVGMRDSAAGNEQQ